MTTAPKVQFLNVGWGDAQFIQLPSGRVTLIDGGDGTASEEQDHPLFWMNRNRIDQLDLMILTHIHEDHVNGLLDIARVKSVRVAILPYEPFELISEEIVRDYGDDLAKRVFQMLASYLELIRLLQQQGTDIRWRSRYGSSDQSELWSEEGVILSHLYPWVEDPQPAYELLMEVMAEDTLFGSETERMEALKRFFALSNDDSSIYRVNFIDEPDNSILLGGDQLEAGWERLAQRMDIRSRIWKVSHHGLSDGFNSRILGWIQPKHCIIPISVERSIEMQQAWDQLRAGTSAAFHLTGSLAPGDLYRIDNGRVAVEIGS